MKSRLAILLVFSGLRGLQAADNDCAALKHAKPHPLKKWTMPNGSNVIVCAFGEAQVRGEEALGWVNLFWQHGKQIKTGIPEVASNKESKKYIFSIEKIDPAHITVTRTFRSTESEEGQDNTAVTESRLDCSGSECALSAEKCLDQGKKVYPQSIKKLEDIANEKKGIAAFPNYEDIVREVGASALAGDQRAMRLLLDQSDRLGADGAVAEDLSVNIALLHELIHLGCLKR